MEYFLVGNGGLGIVTTEGLSDYSATDIWRY